MEQDKIKVGMSTLNEMNGEIESLKKKFDVLHDDIEELKGKKEKAASKAKDKDKK